MMGSSFNASLPLSIIFLPVNDPGPGFDIFTPEKFSVSGF